MKWTQQYHSNYVHYVHMFFACCYDTVYDVYKPNVWYITDMKWRHVFEQQNDFTSWPKLMMQCWYMCDIQVLASWASKMPRPQSENKRVLDFLLEHPRRCFTSDTQIAQSTIAAKLQHHGCQCDPKTLMLQPFAPPATIPPIFWGLQNPVPKTVPWLVDLIWQ